MESIKKGLETAVAQKKTTLFEAKALCRPYPLVCQRSMSSLTALIKGDWSQTLIEIEGQQSMDSFTELTH